MFAKCPESWRRRYLEGDVIPPKLAMVRGKSVHAAIEENMQQKIESHQDLPASDLVAFAVNEFEMEVKHGVYTLDEGDTQSDVSKMKYTIESMATAHAELQAPEYQPVAVEERFTIPLPMLDHDIVGVVDMRSDANEIVDFKTKKRKSSEEDADQSIQLSVYAAAVLSDSQDEVTVKLDCLIEASARKPVTRDLVTATRDRTDLPILGRRVAVVSKAIGSGLFPPASPGSWWCSESWCGYWNTCPYVNSERRAVSLQVKKAMEILGND
jgi:hypothetical protein